MKKGFTLIELLAVIVILAIIALIATPIVLNIIEDSKNSAMIRSSEMYLDAVEYAVAKGVLNNIRVKDDTYNILSSGNICVKYNGSNCEIELEVEVKGETPISGTITIENGAIKNHTLTYKSNITIVDGKISKEMPEFAKAILTKAKENNYYYTTTPDFSKVTQDGEYGLYQAPDDLGTSYYFRGDIENNYVQFGEKTYTHTIKARVFLDYWGETGYDTEEECNENDEYSVSCYLSDEDDLWYGYDDTEVEVNVGNFASISECQSSPLYNRIEDYIEDYVDEQYLQYYGSNVLESTCIEKTNKEPTTFYWRIVRINGDGTVRMIYDGVNKVKNGSVHPASISIDQIWYIDPNYAIKINDEISDSTIKGFIDDWYESNLKSDYGSFIADEIFCNDRQVSKTKYYIDDSYAEESAIPTDAYTYYYMPLERLAPPSPKLTCSRVEDRFTINKSLGNGLLTNPISLITADEIVMAGGMVGSWDKKGTYNESYYMYSGEEYWTNTPELYENYNGASMYYVNSNGYLTGSGVAGEVYDVRPVINLKADVKFTGDGSFDNPYVIVTD